MASSNRKRVGRGSRDPDYRGNQYEDLGIKKSNSVVTGAKPSAPKPMPGKRPTAPKPMPGVRPSAPKPMPSDRMRAGFRVPAEAGPGSHPRMSGAVSRNAVVEKRNPGGHSRSSGIIARSKDTNQQNIAKKSITFASMEEYQKNNQPSYLGGQKLRASMKPQVRRAYSDKLPGSHDRGSGEAARKADGQTRRAGLAIPPGGRARSTGIIARSMDTHQQYLDKKARPKPGSHDRGSGEAARSAANRERKAALPVTPGSHPRLSGADARFKTKNARNPGSHPRSSGIIARSMDLSSRNLTPLNRGPISRNGPLIDFNKAHPKTKSEIKSIPIWGKEGRRYDVLDKPKGYLGVAAKTISNAGSRGWKSVDKTVLGAVGGAAAGAAIGAGGSVAGRAFGLNLPNSLRNSVLPSAVVSGGLTAGMNTHLSGKERLRAGGKVAAIVGGVGTALTVASKVNPMLGAAGGAVVGGFAGAVRGYAKDRAEDAAAAVPGTFTHQKSEIAKYKQIATSNAKRFQSGASEKWEAVDKTVKGALIGGVAGAAAGALGNKTGAVIGTALGRKVFGVEQHTAMIAKAASISKLNKLYYGSPATFGAIFGGIGGAIAGGRVGYAIDRDEEFYRRISKKS